MSKYDMVLFDLDGTLTESKEGITRAIQYALSKFGKQESVEHLVRFIGPPLRDSFRDAYGFSEEQAAQAVSYYREYYVRQGMYENAVYDGIPQLLEALTKSGIPLVVATSKPTPFAVGIVEHFALSQYFDEVVGSNLDGTRASKTEIVGHIIKHHNPSSGTNMVIVGDREHDIVAARNHGIQSIGVTYGFGIKDELELAKPTYLAQLVSDLHALLL